MTDPARWTRPDDIRAAARRRWDDGTLPRAYATGAPFPVIDVPLRHPSSADLGAHFDKARAWVDAVVAASAASAAFDLRYGSIGGRDAGATAVPLRAVLSTYPQAWRLLGCRSRADAFAAVVARSGGDGVAREWALAHPHRAVDLAGDWAPVLAARAWLDRARGSGRYLREVDAPGVDTKFIERHRAVLAAMLGVATSAAGFTRDLGLAHKPAMVRLRFDPAVMGMPAGVHDASLRADELAAVDVRARQALIVENETTFLSVPVPAGAVVLWGRGYDAAEPASLPWLQGIPVLYWGDLDTHGFGILNRVRAHAPHAHSVLMDRDTLQAHRNRWVVEPSPLSAPLPGLDAAEHALYADLVEDRLGTAVRLEQERIDWPYAMRALTAAGFTP